MKFAKVVQAIAVIGLMARWGACSDYQQIEMGQNGRNTLLRLLQTM